jgi:hypothetical protein
MAGTVPLDAPWILRYRRPVRPVDLPEPALPRVSNTIGGELDNPPSNSERLGSVHYMIHDLTGLPVRCNEPIQGPRLFVEPLDIPQFTIELPRARAVGNLNPTSAVHERLRSIQVVLDDLSCLAVGCPHPNDHRCVSTRRFTGGTVAPAIVAFADPLLASPSGGGLTSFSAPLH